MSSQPLPKDRFAHVRGVLDTGMTVAKQRLPTNSEYIRRRTEIHFRISRGQLADLYSEYEEYESIRETVNASSPLGPKIVSHEDTAAREEERPYLILDGREPNEFRRNHLLNACSYPHAYQKRDLVPPNFPAFRNRDGALIIVYCEDERHSREMCKTFVDRGTENIFLLTGGFHEFAAAFPSYVEGELPKDLPMPVTKNTCLTKSALSRIDEAERRQLRESAGGSGSSARGSPSLRRMPLTSRTKLSRFGRSSKAGSDGGMSNRSTQSVAESVISRAASRKGTGRFYND